MICGLVTAAGRSRRMGADKLLLPFGGRTVIRRIVEQLAAAPVERIVVVVGPDRRPITDALAGLTVTFATNPDPGGEMLGSVRCGLAALPVECEAVLVALGDHPAVTAELVGAMLAAFRDGPHGIVVPVHGGRRGHPLLFAARYRDEVMTGFDGVGLRGLPAAHPDDVLELSAGPAALGDIDYPDDYRRELGRLAEDHP